MRLGTSYRRSDAAATVAIVAVGATTPAATAGAVPSAAAVTVAGPARFLFVILVVGLRREPVPSSSSCNIFELDNPTAI